MKCFVGLGSNLGNKRANLEAAARALAQTEAAELIRASPIVETPALVPEEAPEHWRQSFLNAVVEINWRETPNQLLQCLKKIENDLGRESAPRWAPRVIDLDLLTFGEDQIDSLDLRIPHAEMGRRQFVLAPLKHLCPTFTIPGQTRTVLESSRTLPAPLPLWMGILNLTPDSFSDGNTLANPKLFADQLGAWAPENVQLLDLGAESTRPGATRLSPSEEWSRLAPALEIVLANSEIFRPWVSVDTYHAETAARAVELGVDMINDVSGLSDPAMLDVVQGSNCQYVFMHSLTVPADPLVQLEAEDPVLAIKHWALSKLEQLERAGVHLDRVTFDPGIGFGKTPRQSLDILQQIENFFDLPVRILVGHSRKSFLSQFHDSAAVDRDFETLGVSLQLAEKGVDILRVHSPASHQRTFRTFRELA